jgi:hypothetical protein
MATMRAQLLIGHSHKRVKKKKEMKNFGRSRMIDPNTIFLKGELMDMIKTSEILMFSRTDSIDST